jgi:excisionase family DNA binding protein
MSVFKRGKFYWFKLKWRGKVFRKSTKLTNVKGNMTTATITRTTPARTPRLIGDESFMSPRFVAARRALMEARNFHSNDTLLTVDEVAQFLKLPKSTVYELTRNRSRMQGQEPIPCFKVGKRLRFSKDDVVGWLDRLSQKQEEQ